ncbi:TonB-dependent siderophore receptor [Paracoccus aerodenitrificans]|uniref:TonB-dependent siderophore receptor n=1 Tax=Paracoccus aerodenitrificans TaxID=3017781 RepID=UPI0022F02DA8|nr:TonB-dependent siderophore receptor [Paracoccus aerodenitrificans]WBU63862.1 TonB-dependent siderophore receptor [Paracoccus aerodenitrificans]
MLAALQASAQETTPMVLDTVTLYAIYETEGTGSYASEDISIGDKDTRTQREVPQSTTVVTHQRLEDGNYTSLDSALRETPGLFVLANDDGRSSLYSRGFEFDSLYLNGLPSPLDSIYGGQADMATVDHIEVLRGPSGLFVGSGEPAGAINMRLKQAQDVPAYSITGRIGSWNHRRIEADATGALNESGTIRGRIVGAYGDEDNWVDDVDNKTKVLYGTLAADLTPDSTATFSINHRLREITPFNGLPTYEDGSLLDVDRDIYTGADWNYFDNDVTDYIAEYEYRMADGGHVKVSALYSSTEADFLYGYAAAAAAANGDVRGMRWLNRDYDQDALSLDAYISKPFQLFGSESNLIVGMDHRRIDSTMYNGVGVIPGTFNIYDWNTSVARPDAGFSSKEEREINQTGLYAQWRVKPTPTTTAIAGGRLSWYDADITGTTLATGATTTTEIDEDSEFTPYLGLIKDINDTISVYASYTEIFQPQADTDASGDLIEPRTGRQYELGVKSELRPGLFASAAYFDLKDKNRAIGDADNPGYSLAQGEARVRGLEAEISGSPLPGWELTAGYTYTDTDFIDTTFANGSEFYTPAHMLQLWTKYRFQRAGMEKWQIGGGITAFSNFKNVVRRGGTATDVEAPGYAVLDLMASYDVTDQVQASLTVNNALDKEYYERVGSSSVFNYYGEPRSVNFKLQAKF